MIAGVRSRTWGGVGHNVIQLSSKFGITIRMAHAQYGMLDEVSALKGSLQNKKLGWFWIWILPLKFCQFEDPGLPYSPIIRL